MQSFVAFVGPRVKRLLLIDIFVGFFWFSVESSFIFVLQGFLASIGMLDASTAFLPSWYPSSFESNILILLIFGTLRCLALMMKNYCVIYTSQVFVCEKRSILLDRALKTKSSISNNETISAFSELVAQAGSHVVNGTHLAHGLIITALFGLACLKVAFWESASGIFFLIVALIPLKIFARRVSSYGEELLKSWNISYSTLLNGLKNIFFLRLHEMTNVEVNKGQAALKNYEENYKLYAITSSLMLGLPQLLGIIVLSVTAWLGINYLGTKPSALISFFYLFIRFAQNASQTYNYASYFRLTSQSFIQLRKTLNQYSEPSASQHNPISANDEMRIDIKDLVIGYNQDKPLSSPLSYSFGSKQLFLVKGPSGAGKTTLLKTFVGEMQPLSGEVLFNGKDIKGSSNLSSVIGYVGPEPFLIYGTVKENLLYGNHQKEVSESELWNALRSVGIDQAILKLPHGLEEILLDETQLSSGQKQRLSFARALLRKPQILILDEATANIDHDTESKIIAIIEQLRTKMFIFVISHKNTFDHLATERLDFDGQK